MWRWLFNQLGLIITALAFALVVWAVATSEENPGREGNLADPLPVEILSPASLIVSQKSVETVHVRVHAPQAVWDGLQRSNFRAVADLNSLGVGSFDVPIRVTSEDPQVTVVSIEPQTINVTIEPAKSRFFGARAEILDAAPLGYSFKPPTINESQVVVSGPASLVDQVAEVVAEVYLRGARAPIEREATFVARDAQGKEVKSISVAPASAVVNVVVEQRVGFKDVSIRTVLRGNVAPGYWISNILVNPSTTTVVGNADALAKISGFVETAPVDVNNATLDVTTRPALILPDGVSVLNSEAINIRVSVTPILGGQTVRRRVTVQNLRPGQIATISPEQVDVILAGPLPNLQNLPQDSPSVVIDAANLSPGVYPLKPRVLGATDPLKVQSIVPDTIQLIIVDATPTPPK